MTNPRYPCLFQINTRVRLLNHLGRSAQALVASDRDDIEAAYLAARQAPASAGRQPPSGQ
jgi:hypothetical protein